MSSAKERFGVWFFTNYPNAAMAAVQVAMAYKSGGVFAAVREIIKQHPIWTMLLSNSVTAWALLYYFSKDQGGIKRTLFRMLMATARAVPMAAGAIDAEQKKIIAKMQESVIGHDFDEEPRTVVLPEKGMAADELLAQLRRWSKKDEHHWKEGRVSGGIYHGGDELSEVITQSYGLFCLANPLHPDLFPAVRKMEAEVVQMVVNMFNGDENACGAMTSGGTESILMACKAYREWARKTKGIVEPEMVAPITAHAAFDKAANYFGIKLIRVPVDETTFKVMPEVVEKAVTANTIAIVGSTPQFPQGVFDPIGELAKIAKRHNIGLHVDCCLGSFLVPHLNKAGYPTPAMDFRVDGVTSISADPHKFGFTPKGSSTVLYNSKELRKCQYFVAADWPGGIYASPTMAGSRPGALVAATWAAMMHIGEEGYVNSVKVIMEAARKIAAQVPSIDGLKLMGCTRDTESSVVTFTNSDASLNIYNVQDAMSSRGWNLNALQLPAGIHLCVTYANAGRADDFVADLKDAVEEVRTAPKGKYKDGMGAIYGTAASLPDRSIVEVLAKAFLDCLYIA